MNTQQSGNVLFLILIAVALFAALAYAVTQSTRSGGGDTSKENAILKAAQIVQYGTLLKNTIMRLNVSKNCTLPEISFENPFIPYYANTNSPMDNHCHVFHPNGGNLSYNSFTGIVTDYAGMSAPENIGFTTVNIDGTGGEELVFFIRGGIPKDVCNSINTKLGLSSTGTWDTGADTYGFYAGNVSPYDYSLSIDITDGGARCYFDSTDPSAASGGSYVQVLMTQ